MKLTLLKWKYQIIKEGNFFSIYKTPYGMLSFLLYEKFIDCFMTLEEADNKIKSIINEKSNKKPRKVIKEYLI